MIEFNGQNILIKKEGHTLTIVLNRPEKLNALSPALIRELLDSVRLAAENSDLRVIVITGAGRAFSAGGDIEEDLIPVSRMSPRQWKSYIQDFCEVIKRIYFMEKPTLAAINGIVVGGGLDLAMACDIRVASDQAKFGHGYTNMGIISDMGGNYFLPRLIGLGKAKYFAFTGDFISAREAASFGLVEKVFPHDEFESAVSSFAEKIAERPTAALILTKEAMHKSLNMDLDTSLDYSLNLQSALLDSEDLKEAISAFLEKRKPNFIGK